MVLYFAREPIESFVANDIQVSLAFPGFSCCVGAQGPDPARRSPLGDRGAATYLYWQVDVRISNLDRVQSAGPLTELTPNSATIRSSESVISSLISSAAAAV